MNRRVFMKFSVEGKALKVEGEGRFYAKLGSMVANKGKFKFEKSTFGPDSGGSLFGKVAKLAIKSVTGEKTDLMKVEGSGICYLAHNAYNIMVIKLKPSGVESSLYIESSEVLALSDDCKVDIVALKKGGMAGGGGLFTTKVSYGGENSYVAIILKGEPIFLEGPCNVDPQAIIAWTGKEPDIVADINFKVIIGKSSGETFQMRFTEQGQKVIVQPAERIININN